MLKFRLKIMLINNIRYIDYQIKYFKELYYFLTSKQFRKQLFIKIIYIISPKIAIFYSHIYLKNNVFLYL